MFGTLSLLRSRKLLLLWGSQVLSAIGDQLYSIAVVWTAVTVGGSAAGWVVGAQSVAVLVLGLLGGAFADVWDRRRVLIASDLIRAVLTMIIPALLWSGHLHLWHLAAVGAGVGALNSLFDPALQASLPVLSGTDARLQAATALMDSTKRVARVVGPGLTGALLALIPMPHFFTLDAVTFLCSAAAIGSMGRVFSEPGAEVQRERRSIVRDARELVSALRVRTDVLVAIGAVAVGNFAWGLCYVVGLPLLVRDTFHGDAGAFGLMMAAYGLGNVTCMLAMGGMELRRWVRLSAGGLAAMGAGYLVLGVATTPGGAMTGLVIASIGGPLQNLTLVAMLQRALPVSHLGKAFSLYMVAASGGASLGSACAAVLFAHAPTGPAMVAFSLLTIAVALGGGVLAAAHARTVERAVQAAG